MFRSSQVYGLNKLLPSIEYLNKQVYDKYKTPMHKKIIEANNEIEEIEIIKEEQSKESSADIVKEISVIKGVDLTVIALNEILLRLKKIETYLKLTKGVNLNQAANYLDIDMNEIYKLIALKELDMDDNKMISLDDLREYKTTLE